MWRWVSEKVYHHIPHPGLSFAEEQERFEGVSELSTTAELFYAPEPWTSITIDSWNKMNPEERLWNLNSRHGWVSDITPILPFAISYSAPDSTAKNFVVDGGLSTVKVTVVLNPSVWVIPTKRLNEFCRLEVQSRTASGQPRSTRMILKPWVGISTLDTWKVTDERLSIGVMRRLERINVASGDAGFGNPMCSFYDLHVDAINAANRANAAGQPAAYYGEPTNYEL